MDETVAVAPRLSESGIGEDVLHRIHRQILMIHEVDQAIRKGLSAGRFRFTYWPMTGQEAIPACLASLVTPYDYMVTTYRGIHDLVAKGVPLPRLFAEMMGRQAGVNKGKGGSPHVCDPASGAMLTTGIVGAGTPIANGLALAAKMRGEPRITVVNFGDGATSIGAVHEAMNLAGLWRLPIVFLCQNNQIGEYTAIPDYTAGEDFVARAEALGLRGLRVDGNDPVRFYAAMRDVIAKTRRGEGATFVEATTLRLGGHAGIGEPPHLTKEELAAARQVAPVAVMNARMIESGLCGQDDIDAIRQELREEIAAAIEIASASPVTPVEEMFTDVYADSDVVPRRGHYPRRAEEAAPAGETREMNFAGAVQSAHDVALGISPDVFALGEDIGDPTGGVFKTTLGLETKWGRDRVRPTPISEQAIIGAATGAGLVGMRPVAEIMFNDFMAVCLDQVANHAAKQRFMSGGATHAPITIRTICAGGVGGLGAQHSQSLEAWLLHVPGLKVVYPSTPIEAKGLLLSCIFDDDPCVHIEAMGVMHGAKEAVPVGDYRIPLGVAKVKRPGTDITLITYGLYVSRCLDAAKQLEAEGISCEVLDLRTLMPLDYHRIIDSVKKTGRALVVHLATEFCGLGAEIAATLNDELFGTLKAPVSRLGAEYLPIAFSRDIETAQLPSVDTIIARVRGLVTF